MGDLEMKEQSPIQTTSAGSVVDEPICSTSDELVLSKDGFKLFPQPVLQDKLDPLTWSSVHKHIILAIIMSM